MTDILHDDQCLPLSVLLYRLYKKNGCSVPDSFSKIQEMVEDGLLEYRLDDDIQSVMVSRPLERN